MKKSIGALFVLAASAGMLAACNGGNSIGPGPGPTSGPTGNCGAPPNQMEVVSPIPGSRKVSPNLGNIYVATKTALPPSNLFNFFIAESNGSSTYTGPFAPIAGSQLPQSHAKPSYPNPIYYASAIVGPYGSAPWLSPDQAVTVLWNDGGRTCTPHTVVVSFHTKG